MSELCRCSERGPSALELAEALCKFLSLVLQTMVIEVQHRFKYASRTFTDYPRLEASIKAQDANVAAAE